MPVVAATIEPGLHPGCPGQRPGTFINDPDFRSRTGPAIHRRPHLQRSGIRNPAGERIGLVGPNGAGKTTLMQILAGLDQADYGRLFVRPGIRVSLLRQEIEFSPGQDSDRSRQIRAGLALGPPARARGSRPGARRSRGRQRPEAPPSSVTTRSTARSNIRMHTASIIASRKSLPASASARPNSSDARRLSPVASSRGSCSPNCSSKART